MTVLAGLLILTAVLFAAGLTVLGAIAAAAEIFPPSRGPVGNAHARLIGHPRRGVRSEYPRGSE